MLKKEQAHVVILGGGFGGLAVARALNVPRVRITLLDRSNHHLFQPLLYQVACAALAAPDVSAPIRKLLWRQKNATVLMATIQRPAARAKTRGLVLTPDEFRIEAMGVPIDRT